MTTYFSFTGRIRRTHYALRTMLSSAVWMCIIFLVMPAAAASADTEQPFWVPLVFLLAFIMWASVTWFSIATNTKRCHDLDKSGWWQLIPFYGFALLFAEGTRGPNAFGDDPKAAAMKITTIQTITTKKENCQAGVNRKNDVWDPTIIAKEWDEEGLNIPSSISNKNTVAYEKYPSPANNSSSNHTSRTPGHSDNGGYKKGSLYD